MLITTPKAVLMIEGYSFLILYFFPNIETLFTHNLPLCIYVRYELNFMNKTFSKLCACAAWAGMKMLKKILTHSCNKFNMQQLNAEISLFYFLQLNDII